MGVPEFSVKGVRLRKVFFRLFFGKFMMLAWHLILTMVLSNNGGAQTLTTLFSNLFSESP